jgi:ankyrin repeat protein
MMSGNMRDTALHFTVWSEAEANCRFVNACYAGDIDTAADMLHVSNVNLQAASGYAALHPACWQGHVDIVRMLLAVFASTDVTDDESSTHQLCGLEVLLYLQYAVCSHRSVALLTVYRL